MKNLLGIAFFLVTLFSQAQFGSQQIITGTANGTRIIFATDINNDGKVDILSANKFGSSITWYQNPGRLGIPWTEKLVGPLNQTIYAFPADINGDGFIDVLGISTPDNIAPWFENLDGEGNFVRKNNIVNRSNLFTIVAADIDLDGDMDVITASAVSGLVWNENLNGNGQFGTQRIIDGSINCRNVTVADFDGDGDMDIVATGTGNFKIAWYENLDGLGNFGPRNIIDTIGLAANSIFVADIDSDGDMDIIFASGGDSEVGWYENLDGLGTFGPKRTVTNSLTDAHSVYAADLDNDGDMDLLATRIEVFGGEVVWYENLDGLGNFGPKKTITTDVMLPRSVIAADIDGDGALDVVSASQNDDKIAWNRNLILGINDNKTKEISIFPNPGRDKINIVLNSGEISKISLFDVLGKNVLQRVGNLRVLDISTLQNGIYFLKIITDEGALVRKIIKE